MFPQIFTLCSLVRISDYRKRSYLSQGLPCSFSHPENVRGSIDFPRQHVKSIEEGLLCVKNTVVQVCFLLLFLIYASAVNTSFTPQTSAGTSHVGLKHEGKIRQAAAKPNSTVMGNSIYRCSSSNTLVFSSNHNSVMEPMTSTAQAFSYYSNHTCSGISVDETIFQESVLCQKSENTARGYGDGSSSSSDNDNSAEDK